MTLVYGSGLMVLRPRSLTLTTRVWHVLLLFLFDLRQRGTQLTVEESAACKIGHHSSRDHGRKML